MRLEREERIEHEDLTKASDDRTQKKKERRDEIDGQMDKEKIEKDLLENMEKTTEDVDSNKPMDKVTSNVEKSKDQMEHQERNVAEVETVSEENESAEDLEGEELNSRDEDDGPQTHGKTGGSPWKLVVEKHLKGRTKELIKEAKELVGVAEETENEIEFVGSVICIEDSDDGTFTLCNDRIEGKLGMQGRIVRF